MAPVYFIIVAVVVCVSSSIGLVSSVIIMPEATHEQIYLLGGKISGGIILSIILLGLVLKKAGYKIKIKKEIIKNR